MSDLQTHFLLFNANKVTKKVHNEVICKLLGIMHYQNSRKSATFNMNPHGIPVWSLKNNEKAVWIPDLIMYHEFHAIREELPVNNNHDQPLLSPEIYKSKAFAREFEKITQKYHIKLSPGSVNPDDENCIRVLYKNQKESERATDIPEKTKAEIESAPDNSPQKRLNSLRNPKSVERDPLEPPKKKRRICNFSPKRKISPFKFQSPREESNHNKNSRVLEIPNEESQHVLEMPQEVLALESHQPEIPMEISQQSQFKTTNGGTLNGAEQPPLAQMINIILNEFHAEIEAIKTEKVKLDVRKEAMRTCLSQLQLILMDDTVSVDNDIVMVETPANSGDVIKNLENDFQAVVHILLTFHSKVLEAQAKLKTISIANKEFQKIVAKQLERDANK